MCFSFSIVLLPSFSFTYALFARANPPPKQGERGGPFIPCYTNCYSILKMNQLRRFNTSTPYNMPLPPTQIIYADNNKQLFSLTCQVVNKTTENLGFTDSIFG